MRNFGELDCGAAFIRPSLVARSLLGRSNSFYSVQLFSPKVHHRHTENSAELQDKETGEAKHDELEADKSTYALRIPIHIRLTRDKWMRKSPTSLANATEETKETLIGQAYLVTTILLLSLECKFTPRACTIR